jgi:hypothetical protein
LAGDLEVLGALVKERSVDLHEELKGVVDHAVNRSVQGREERVESQRA